MRHPLSAGHPGCGPCGARAVWSCAPCGKARRICAYRAGLLSLRDLSLSRLNHRLPGCETHPEVMQGTADVHHEIADAVLPQPDPVFDDMTALDRSFPFLNLVEMLYQPST